MIYEKTNESGGKHRRMQGLAAAETRLEVVQSTLLAEKYLGKSLEIMR